MSTGDGEEGRDLLRLVHRGEQPVRRHFLLSEFNPLATKTAIVVPVQLRVVGENLQSAPYQEKNTQYINEVIDPQPYREGEIGCLRIHRAPFDRRRTGH